MERPKQLRSKDKDELAVYDETGYSIEDLRRLSVLYASEYAEPLRKLFLKLQRADATTLFDEKVDFPATQFARGRLSMLRQIEDFLHEEAERMYERSAAAGQRSPEPNK